MSEIDQSTEAADLDAAIEQIDDLVAEGDFDQAEELLEGALERFDADPRLLVLQTEIALESEDFSEAVFAADHALEKVEDAEQRGRLLSLKGYAQYYLDAIDEARQTFNAAVRCAPELWTAIVGRAMVHENLGYFRASMLDLDRAIALDDQEGQPFAIRGSIHLRTGNNAEAERDFKYAVDSDPDDEESRLQLARLQALDQRTAEAIETLEPLVDEGEDPEFVVPAALLRSQLSLTLGSTEAGSDDARKAIELAPDEPWGYLQLAACYLTAMNPGEALEALKQAESRVDDVYDLPDLFALRASAYDQLEKPEKAAQMRDQAEGWARLPGFVYGDMLNPAQNIPINPNKPVDVRAILGELFGDPRRAPQGYEKAIRDVIDRIPQIVEQNPGVGRIQIELPQVAGMEGPPRSLIIQVNNQQRQQKPAENG